MMNKAKQILKDTFGYDGFRPLQKEVIQNVLSNKDTLCIMPTGGGKSLCYQIPALIFDGLTIVVSPLISLMEDQVSQLQALGIQAVMLNSSLTGSQYQENIQRIRRTEIKLLYLAPETLLMEKTLTLISSQKIACFTIDEAHCISEWGHEFRPEYRQLVSLRKRFPQAVCLALTATATHRVQGDIRASLKFDESASFVASFNRENLFLEIGQKSQSAQQVLDFLEKFPNQSGIIYCHSRRQVDDLNDFLDNRGFSVRPYHAGLPNDVRQENQTSFIRDDIQIMVATIAFGMGINKPNIRFILHFDLPNNIESYYQQIGRAGRDGLRADCLFLFSYGDIRKVKFFIQQKQESEQIVATTQLNALIGLVETEACRRIPLLSYFGEEYPRTNCGMCDNCLAEDQPGINVTVYAQKFLSCVKHSQEIFGAGHVIDILRGSKSQKIKKFDHHLLSTYGIGADLSKQEWFYLSRKFVQKGLLLQDMQHGSLKLTEKAWDVLRGNQEVWTKMDLQKQAQRSPKADQAYDVKLFEQLRQLRKTLADDSNVPPYVIFPDKTLIEMAIYYPQSETGMMQLHGVGSVKFARYGDPFMEKVSAYCQANQLEAQPKHPSPRIAQSSTKKPGKSRQQVVGEKFNAGASLSELTGEFNIQMRTLLNHLYKFHGAGNSLTVSDTFLEASELDPEKQKAVLDTFEQFGTAILRPIFDALNQEVSFEELSIMRLYYLSTQETGTSTKS